VPIAPEPRTSNMEISSPHAISDKKLEEMMQTHCKKNGLEYGLYIEAGAGCVDVSTSMFMIKPDSMWKVYTDGRRERVTSAVIVGSPYELLQQIEGIGNTPRTTLGTCGSNSGGVPVQERAPAIFLPKVTVTAMEEEKYTQRLLEREK
jgi:predicted Zn-dependent protease